MTDPRSSILANEDMRRILLGALDRIDASLGREDVAELRDIIRVLIDPFDSKSQSFIHTHTLWDGESQERVT